jgi:putative holliday junction resolvase
MQGVKNYIVSLDVGERRVGVARCLEGARHVEPYRAFPRGGGRAEQEIIKLINELPATLLVVGSPLSAAGARTPQCEKIEAFCRRITRRVSIELVYEDEYLSSEEAIEQLNFSPADIQRHRNSGVIDTVSASIILKRYLSRTSFPGVG